MLFTFLWHIIYPNINQQKLLMAEKKPNIALVDDDPKILELTAKYLRDQNLNVFVQPIAVLRWMISWKCKFY